MGQSNTYSSPGSSDPSAALHLSQQAPHILGKLVTPPSRLSSLLGVSRENIEQFRTLEELMLACLRTGDDKSAKLCLDQLSRRFGPSDDRVVGLQSVYREAIAEDDQDLERSLHDCERIIAGNPLNLPLMKRRVALLRCLSRPADAIQALTELLEAVPTDAEAWCELADLYQAQGMAQQAIFCLEEALLIAPHSYNLHARAGELHYVCSSSSADDRCSLLARSVRYFCRSIELCDDYLRGYYGLALASSELLADPLFQKVSRGDPPSNAARLPAKEVVEKLRAFATDRLGKIIERRSLGSAKGDHEQSDLAAARELLSRLR